MTSEGKNLEKMRNNPRDWKIQTLEAVAKRLQIKIRKSRGSHVVFMHDDSDIVVTVPANRPIKPIYIQQFLALVDDIGEKK